MLTPELEAYIKDNLSAGGSVEEIRSSLLTTGWNPADVDQALQSALLSRSESNLKPAELSGGTHPTSTLRKIGFISFLSLVIVAIIGGGAYVVYKHEKTTPTGSTISTPTPPLDLVTYNNSQYGYSFQYPKPWKIDTLGNATIVTSPATQNSSLYKNEGIGDVIISLIPHTSVSVAPGVTVTSGTQNETADQQAKYIATLEATNGTTQLYSEGGLAGYSALTKTSSGSTLDIILAATSKSVSIQFPNVTSQSQLSAGQKAVLSSIKITK